MKDTLIINIGDELLSGHTVNTNASFISLELYEIGISTSETRVIPDTKDALLNVLNKSVGKFTTIIISGGLGPTHDDRTKGILCEFFSSELKFNENIWKDIEKIFSSRNIKFSDINKEQAMFPHNAKPIKNIYGTAPGIHYSQNNSEIFALPGVPTEMKAMVTNYIIPFLNKNNNNSIVFKDINTYNIPESNLYERLSTDTDFPYDTEIAFLPKGYGVTIRIKAMGADKELLNIKVDKVLNIISEKIPDQIIGYDITNPAEKVFELLLEKRLKISFAESCTGGLVAKKITDIPGSSKVFNESFVTYSNDSKFKQLSVNPITLSEKGAVSYETVDEMLDGLLAITDADVVCAISGIAGPDGGTTEKPVGTIYIGCALREGNKRFVKLHNVLGNRNSIRERSANKLFIQVIELLTK
ncbi:MAG: CinA family nicotinamide mononucleotide deamidase-related protein [Candidatus Delongbacteria bacterium]|jgi:nicotinamide-nucleotide amidase|nr:CinA family nicotinamide mononucleotide deamidase-related protein [Candidatus Delongbacteria bacterium]